MTGNSSRGRILVLLTTVTLLTLFSAGCRQRQLYYANRLPAELIAAPEQSLENVDLSRLSRAVGDSDILYAGDTLEVTVMTGVEKEPPVGWKLRIDERGVVEVPLIGAVQIGGLPIPQAEHTIRGEGIRRGKFVNPTVSIALEERRSHRVTVMGAVENPGTYDLNASQNDLLAALAAAGGLTEEAGTTIEIRHPPKLPGTAASPTQMASFTPDGGGLAAHTLRVDLAAADENGGTQFQLFDGSSVMAMKKPKRFVHVIGLVNKADQYEIPENTDLHLLEAIAMAGGLKLEVADKVHVIRRVETEPDPVVIQASIRRAKKDGVSNIRLAPGDVVSVEETPTTFVVGTIRDFVRFGFTSGIPGI